MPEINFGRGVEKGQGAFEVMVTNCFLEVTKGVPLDQVKIPGTEIDRQLVITAVQERAARLFCLESKSTLPKPALIQKQVDEPQEERPATQPEFTPVLGGEAIIPPAETEKMDIASFLQKKKVEIEEWKELPFQWKDNKGNAPWSGICSSLVQEFGQIGKKLEVDKNGSVAALRAASLLRRVAKEVAMALVRYNLDDSPKGKSEQQEALRFVKSVADDIDSLNAIMPSQQKPTNASNEKTFKQAMSPRASALRSNLVNEDKFWFRGSSRIGTVEDTADNFREVLNYIPVSVEGTKEPTVLFQIPSVGQNEAPIVVAAVSDNLPKYRFFKRGMQIASPKIQNMFKEFGISSFFLQRNTRTESQVDSDTAAALADAIWREPDVAWREEMFKGLKTLSGITIDTRCPNDKGAIRQLIQDGQAIKATQEDVNSFGAQRNEQGVLLVRPTVRDNKGVVILRLMVVVE